MYIVVAGGGMVGGGLVRKLIQNKHDVILVDPHQEICDKMYAETGVIAVNGSAGSIEVLKQAGIEKAEVVVAATDNDADNLACAILAKSFEVPRIIVRMRDPAYENPYRIVGVNTIVRVTDLMVNQMMVDIENPEVRRITTIGGGKADIFMVTVPEGGNIAGKKVKDIASSPQFPSKCVFVAVHNRENGDFSISRGDQVVNEGDELYLISTAEYIKKATDLLTSQNSS